MLSHSEEILRLIVAAVLGGLIGLERERLNWAAGLRTHMLVCVGATLFMIVSAFGFAEIRTQPAVGLDPSRVAAQVVSGIGFLGAGNIVLRREAVRGLTTAASLWTVAAVGLAVGGGMYVAAVAATVIILGILAGLKPLEGRMFTGVAKQPSGISVVIQRGQTSVADIEALAEQNRLIITHITVRHKAAEESEVQFHMRKATVTAVSNFVQKLQGSPGVRKVRVTPDNRGGRRRPSRSREDSEGIEE